MNFSTKWKKLYDPRRTSCWTSSKISIFDLGLYSEGETWTCYSEVCVVWRIFCGRSSINTSSSRLGLYALCRSVYCSAIAVPHHQKGIRAFEAKSYFPVYQGVSTSQLIREERIAKCTMRVIRNPAWFYSRVHERSSKWQVWFCRALQAWSGNWQDKDAEMKTNVIYCTVYKTLPEVSICLTKAFLVLNEMM